MFIRTLLVDFVFAAFVLAELDSPCGGQFKTANHGSICDSSPVALGL
jgi:hypothetical protein